MKLKFVYGNDVVVLPLAVAAQIDKATKRDLRVLLSLAATPELSAAELAAALSLTEAEVEAALAFWRGTGVLVAAEDAAESSRAPAASAPQPKTAALQTDTKKRPVVARGMPTYTSTDLADMLERRADFAALLDACQQTLGKIFNTAEVAIVAGLLEYHGFDGEYILLLLSHCARMGKKTLRYAEKMADMLYDEGVVEASALEERLARIEEMAQVQGQIRKIFGLSSRALTTKEKTMIENWIFGMKYDYEVIKLAYEATVNAINDPTIAYANTILERWNSAGLRTVEEINRADEDYRRKKRGGSSFDANDFFEAALKNTYGEQGKK